MSKRNWIGPFLVWGVTIAWVVLILTLPEGITYGANRAVHLPDGTGISNISDMSVLELANLMADSCDRAMAMLKEQGRQGLSRMSRESYMAQMKTARKIFGLIQKRSQAIGPGYITVQFPKGTGQLFSNSFELERLKVFLRYISKDSHGRKVDFILVGTEPLQISGSKIGVGILAKKRVESIVQIINRNLANIPHRFCKAYCNGDILDLTNDKEGEPSHNVYVVAVYNGTMGRYGTLSLSGLRAKKTQEISSRSNAWPTFPPSPQCVRPRFKNSIGMEFVYIPPGTFVMGSPPNEYGHDLTEREHVVVFTKGFYLQTTEVTQGEWKAIMGENPSYFLNCGDDCPVENVSWYDAQEFIERLNEREGTTRYRLPTEAEWEYACRAGTKAAFADGGTITGDTRFINPSLGRMGWYYSNSEEATHPVAQKQPNAWGLYDMHGNVWEWCQDWMAQYPFEVARDPKGPPSGLSRIRRGGSWQEYPVFCRSAYRGSSHPKNKSPSIGFRVAMGLKKPVSVREKAYRSQRVLPREAVREKPCIFIRDIDFDFDSAKIRPEMKLVLDKAVQILKKRKGEILLEGYTCNLGSDAYNLLLSERRALAVKEYLIKRGIDPSRIQTKWYGKKRPKFPNKNEAGRRLNRRVEIHLIPE